jgi:hypothetical protein
MGGRMGRLFLNPSFKLLLRQARKSMKKNQNLLPAMLLAGMSLGTAWAIRGQFGHEHGAAWAGAIGALSILLLAGRDDWYQRVFKATLAGAAGWGLGGMMSYGLVVGYGRDTEFQNVFYGLAMLFVIGGLYGYLGGGLFGLSLSNSSRSSGERVSWPQLLVEMTVGALIFYFFLIEQFGWLMTPPRSELWAGCMGMAAALTWYLVRHQHYAALRVAAFAGLGGGFGFAFGNFLQVLGQVSGWHFNFWNVMEYSLGFFGGAGMAYGTFTSEWAPLAKREERNGVPFALLFVVLLIPFVVWEQSFELAKLEELLLRLGAESTLAPLLLWGSLGLVLLLSAYWFRKFYLSQPGGYLQYTQADLKTFFLGHFALYILFSLLITGAILSTYRVEQYLYLVNFALIAFLITKFRPSFMAEPVGMVQWAGGLVTVGVLIALLAFMAIRSHDELPHAQKRFGAPPVAQQTP